MFWLCVCNNAWCHVLMSLPCIICITLGISLTRVVFVVQTTGGEILILAVTGTKSSKLSASVDLGQSKASVGVSQRRLWWFTGAQEFLLKLLLKLLFSELCFAVISFNEQCGTVARVVRISIGNNTLGGTASEKPFNWFTRRRRRHSILQMVC